LELAERSKILQPVVVALIQYNVMNKRSIAIGFFLGADQENIYKGATMVNFNFTY